MKKVILIITALTFICLATKGVYAAGTAAGTNITNKATAAYTVSGIPGTQDSNTTTVKVAEIINVTVTWQDGANVPVAPGDTNKAATYKVTNTGNGTEAWTLSVNTAIAGDNFDPTLASIYLDANGNGVYDSGTDTLYVAGTNDPSLAADGFKTVFVLCNIPGAATDGQIGDIKLTATSKTGTGAAGTVFAGAGDGGVDAVIGGTTGAATTTAKYQVVNVTVSVVKAQTVSDQYAGTQPIPGATIRYSITVTVTGTGTAVGVVITDPIPANTTYTAGTLKLNGAPLTDGAGDDAGDYNLTNPGKVTVSLGNLTSASAVQTITFDVKIQ